MKKTVLFLVVAALIGFAIFQSVSANKTAAKGVLPADASGASDLGVAKVVNGVVPSTPSVVSSGPEFLVADFNSGDKPNNVGGDFGTWDKDPNDDSQSCKMQFAEVDAVAADGFSLRLDYDVDSPQPAYNGFWMRLGEKDYSSYQNINLFLKGEGTFPQRIKIELKDATKRSARSFVTGVSDDWQKLTIPLARFKNLDLKGLSEFVLVFDDVNSNPKSGTVYLDQVTFS